MIIDGPHILAIRHDGDHSNRSDVSVELPRPPVAIVTEVESVMGGWWFRAGGYPVGTKTGTLLDD